MVMTKYSAKCENCGCIGDLIKSGDGPYICAGCQPIGCTEAILGCSVYLVTLVAAVAGIYYAIWR